ncbi:MAG: HEAT repeat domain-containing protein [Pirellulaceae bacterium]|nr:HEAT repeat domain-containing protein [Pirellulaceae bacterium]
MLRHTFYYLTVVPGFSVCLMATFILSSLPAGNCCGQAPDFSEELPRIQPLEPAEAIKSFRLQSGFKIEQVASEPLVTDPVAIAFDENGRLYVVEMRGYSEDEKLQIGRIRRLEDQDGDGQFDHSTTYVDGLSWPTAIACYDGGIFVAAAPHIWYYKDQDGDGRADESRIVFDGFGRTNVQGLLNTFKWGLDQRLYGATSSSGATIQRTNAAPINLRGRDFAFDPRTERLTPISGGAQHGMSFNGWGERFVCSNSDHIQFICFEDHYIKRNPFLAPPPTRQSIASDGPQANVFRASPVEPWRVVRTRLRVAGDVPGPVEGGGTAAGYFTGATGVTIYRGDAWPHDEYDLAFVCDVGSNLIHRKKLHRTGISYQANRIDEGDEFLTSTDIWFRPVQLANGPDGALYVVDMYREVIEHPKSLPPVIKRHLDLTSGRERGRIYRIIPESFSQESPAKLGNLSNPQLAELLDHPNGWHRETAARLLWERNYNSAVPILKRLVTKAAHPEGRIRALRSLKSAKQISPTLLHQALSDPHPQVRRHAVQLTEELLPTSSRLTSKLCAMTDDPSLLVRYQLAFSLGRIGVADRIQPLSELAKQDAKSRYMRAAIQSSLGSGCGAMLAHLAKDRSWCQQSNNLPLIQQLVTQIARQQTAGDIHELEQLLQRLQRENDGLAATILANLNPPAESELARTMTTGVWLQIREQMLTEARQFAQDTNQTSAQRVAAIERLSLGQLVDQTPLLTELISPSEDLRVQLAAVNTLTQFNHPTVANILIEAWPTCSPQLRRQVSDKLMTRTSWQEQLLEAFESGRIASGDIDLPRWKSLLKDNSPILARLNQLTVSTATSADRHKLLKQYQAALQQTGDPHRGKKLFSQHCARCHKADDTGFEIGPNLAAMKNRGRQAILTNVILPNQEVNPQYLSYTVTTQDGRVLSGMLTDETATSVTIRRDQENSDTLLRVDLEELRSTGRSLMPEGFEKEIDPQGMTDLISFLMSLK